LKSTETRRQQQWPSFYLDFSNFGSLKSTETDSESALVNDILTISAISAR